MAKKVKFNDIVMMERLFEQLSAEEAANGSACPFRDWEILHELDRQVRRREYDHSPARIEQRRKRSSERSKIFDYLEKNPTLKEQMEAKVRESIVPARND
jgi:hypothetical protein